MDANLQFGNCTHPGVVRSQNQDYFGFFETPNGRLFVVCDGMGGHVGGETASHVAVNALRDFLCQKTVEDPELALREALEFANQQLLGVVEDRPELKGMGTTAILLLERQGRLYMANVGDSRLYVSTSGELRQLSRDHSLVQRLLDQKLITPEQAADHPKRNVITSALGVGELTIDTREISAENSPDAIFMLCSDGLSNMVADKEMQRMVRQPRPLQQLAEQLVDKANELGGTDNISVQLVRFAPVSILLRGQELLRHKWAKGGIALAGLLLLVGILSIAKSPAYVPVPNVDTLSRSLLADSLPQRVDGKDSFEILPVLADYRLGRGEEIQDVLDRFGITRMDFSAHNMHVRPDQAGNGDLVRVPVLALHVCQGGESLASLAQAYGCPLERLQRANPDAQEPLEARAVVFVPMP